MPSVHAYGRKGRGKDEDGQGIGQHEKEGGSVGPEKSPDFLILYFFVGSGPEDDNPHQNEHQSPHSWMVVFSRLRKVEM